MRSTYTSKLGRLTLNIAALGGLLILVCCSAVISMAQQVNPRRGFYPGGSYSVSDIETINTTNGNLQFNLPLASLPPGRGGLGATLFLNYNSKLWDSSVGQTSGSSGQPRTETFINESREGGWHYGYQYQLQMESRPSDAIIHNCPDYKTVYIWRLKMIFPDGSSHIFHPLGYDHKGEGYYNITPDGLVAQCQGPGGTSYFQFRVGTTLTYFTSDGSHLRLVIQPDSDTETFNNPWTLYFPDGKRVTGGNAYQRIYDRNNNYIEFQNYTDITTGRANTKIVDQFNRSITIDYGTGPIQESIYVTGFNNEQLTTTVKWKGIIINTSYDSQPSDGSVSTAGFANYGIGVVDQVILPVQAGGLSYTFGYTGGGGTNPGWGEVTSVTLPSGVQATYTHGTEDGGFTWLSVIERHLRAKTLNYALEYDGVVSAAPTEAWSYAVNRYSGTGDNFYSEIINPDGGIQRDYYIYSNGIALGNKLVYKSERSDGAIVENIWQQNIPNVPFGIGPAGSDVNPYIKTIFSSVRDAAGTPVKTAIKDYKYDKNGNLTQVAEYDWVAYGSVPRDGSGKPIGIPGGLTPKRVVVNSYYSPTPDASDSITDDPDVYCKPSSPQLRNAIESSETRSDLSAGSVVSRTETFYDNPSTTGNLTMERSWDSTKAGISRPLNTGNSISVTHQYDSYGNRTHMTDANNVTTWFVYGSVNGHNNLYVTETKVAVNTPVQQWMMQSYDFHTGLVTQSTDMDNNVTTRTTYDVFGRPILIEEADGIAGVEKQTATEYSDTERRVIVRSDLNTTGDGKLIAIQHYDQLGRIRLTRRLESGNPLEAEDETKGIKIQTRYFAGDAGNQNGYGLVSSPYRAATSGATSGEPGMAWKRTKFDKGGRAIELETFIGSAPPVPWGGNAVSFGKVTMEYDAEFTTVTDQAGKKRRSRVDALGRLVRVDEPDAVGNLGGVATPVQPTDYTYNALGNLIQTSQTGVPNGGSTQVIQNRYFIYSSLGRLVSANNPESGLISYEYDANGNLKKKTDARNTINYNYDELNRNQTVDYSDTQTITPDIKREYDNPSAGKYGKGRLWRSYAGGNESSGPKVEKQEIPEYDALGRAKSVQQSFKNNGTWSSAFTTSQTYDLAGHIKTKTYPSGRNVVYAYDVSGDLNDFTGNIGDGVARTYSTGIQYNPQGQMTREQFGTSTPLYHRRHYNSLGQLFDVRVGTDGGAVNDGPNPAQWTGASWNRGALRSFFSNNLVEYAWPAVAPQADNGNLYRQDHFVPTALDGDSNVTGWVMSADYYCYDSLNRVAVAAEETYTSGGGYTPSVFEQRFIYDRFGNRLVSSMSGTGVPNPGYKINGANNRLIAPTDTDGSQTSDKMQYDASGNLIKDTQTQAGTAGNRTYDAENRMVTADGNNGQANSYTYDADGRRTRRSKNNDSEVWWQVFGIGGELVAEYQLISGTPTLKKEYGYCNGQLLVTAETTGTCQWLVTDALGTPRMIVDQTGELGGVKRRDYLPFGEEILAGVGHRQLTNGYSLSQSQQPRQQFTGKERDSETDLNYFGARYFSSVQGRFTSPDEFAGGPTELFAEVAAHNPTFYADIMDPQSLNKYSYCLGNPLIFVDPDGHQSRKSDILIFWGILGACQTCQQEVARGVLKELGNIYIGIKNASPSEVQDRGPFRYNEPENMFQDYGMTVTEHLATVGSFLPVGKAPINVAMGEGRQAAIITAEVAAEAGVVRAVRNAHLAGGVHPKTKVPFDANGFPDFKAAGVVKAEVSIKPTGTRSGDFAAANKAAGFKKTPKGQTWHHHQDGTTMQLVPRKIHAQTGHDGGFKATRRVDEEDD